MHSATRKILGAASTTPSRVLASLVAAVVVIALAIWLLPEWLNSSTSIDPASQLEVEDWLSAKNATRASLVAFLVAAVGMGTLLYTVRSYRLARTGQVTDRYTKAVDQLGMNDKPQVRVGGVYALQRIVRDSPQDQRAVVDVLVAHIRESRSLSREPAPSAKIPIDVTAALQVLGRHSRGPDLPALDLRELDLREAELTNADLSGCHLDGTHLDGAVLTGASLRGALLPGATLTHAKLLSADLIRADLTSVALKDADFFKAKILAQQLSDTQKAEVVNWEFAELYTAVGPLRPEARTTT
jgi:hypothetical protein